MTFNEAIEISTKATYLAACYKHDKNWEKNEIYYDNEFLGYWAINGNDILKLAGGDLAGKNIKVVPVTLTAGLLDGEDKPDYAWGAYRGWVGTIIKETRNDEVPAYLVKISSDGVNYIPMSINKDDIDFYYGDRI